MADDRPRDSLGRPARPLRYPVKRFFKISEDANETIEEMAQAKNTKPGTIIRRAVMKDVFIYKARKNPKEKDHDQ